MKTVLLIRHAKSSWDSSVSSDFERPLNDRGKKDAPEMARRLLKSGIGVDQFVSSPARRAKKTAEYFVREFGAKEEDILFIPQLYHAGSDDFYDVIRGFDDHKNNIAIFSHNPGITDFVNTLTEIRIDNMPTCSVFAVRIPITSWSSFPDATKEFLRFDYPKATQGEG